ncbi:MAG TPA: bifunctional adenosylcobinamide kinase/adenosylcobinamide-phosphate guanylyltransferase [Syntrophomonadaceae bacterium]|nr:bifunctional adenosylcobinamide kinase/adenosylcobinamide-phosphate guanylyltransferase [Syntrophomonadaceae bacterium]
MAERGKLILITGGVRSGKSSYAGNLAAQIPGPVHFIATCVPVDEEMAARVSHHQQSRPRTWITVEESMDPARIIAEEDGPQAVFILDCLTMLISNYLLLTEKRKSEAEILELVRDLTRIGYEAQGTVIIVSNEVGAGIVPADPVSRTFRDLLGRANQIVASQSDRVYLCVAGLPVDMKALAEEKNLN